MQKTKDTRTDRVAFIVVEGSIAGFMIFRIMDALAEGNSRVFFIAIITNILAMLLVALIHWFKRVVDESFLIPMLIYLMYVSSSLLMRSFVFFFPTCLGVCCVAALYFKHQSLRNYIVITNIISLILMYFELPMMHSARQVLATEMIMLWFINLFGSIFIYMVTVFASDKSNAANRAQDSFVGLLSSTPNRVVLVDSLNRVTYVSRSFLDMTRLKTPGRIIGRPVFDVLAAYTTR